MSDMHSKNGAVESRFLGRHARGFTLIELLVVVAILGILASIGLTLYVNVQMRGRIGKAQADVSALSSALNQYAAHTGTLPTTAQGLPVLVTAVVNAQNATAGPFLNAMPTPPGRGTPAWPVAYVYRTDTAPGGAVAAGRFVVCASGDGVVAHNTSGTLTCP